MVCFLVGALKVDLLVLVVPKIQRLYGYIREKNSHIWVIVVGYQKITYSVDRNSTLIIQKRSVKHLEGILVVIFYKNYKMFSFIWANLEA
ncbi:hypothetical protein MA16_Dca005980 [Dendrobium catenatum]|uniref:Uncharacterized protein n=1 Tax=Dendrobium catenatum TaxID=906689 RepID=A0A2I0WJV3_9ASPA|nr:hypothetical protein MA16_Dca005980 [Dendrobium catenatum]